MTLVDFSTEMLQISRELNSECEHLQGDMRTVRLGKQFDAVFIHDAISYLTTENDLRQAIQTAYLHCRPGGAVLLCPDYTKETFSPMTAHGGHDRGDRGLRYVEWIRDTDPNDNVYTMDMAYLLREGENVQCRLDRHLLGLFTEVTWLQLLREAGFAGRKISHTWSDSKSRLAHVSLS